MFSESIVYMMSQDEVKSGNIQITLMRRNRLCNQIVLVACRCSIVRYAQIYQVLCTWFVNVFLSPHECRQQQQTIVDKPALPTFRGLQLTRCLWSIRIWLSCSPQLAAERCSISAHPRNTILNKLSPLCEILSTHILLESQLQWPYCHMYLIGANSTRNLQSNGCTIQHMHPFYLAYIYL